MAPRTLLFQLVLASLLSGNAYAQHLSIDGITTVRIYYEDPEGIHPVSVQIHHLFPVWDISYVTDTITFDKKQIVLHCPVRVMQEGYVSLLNKEITLFMIPGDTIDVMLSGAVDSPEIAFEGKTQRIQEYYVARSDGFPTSVRQLTINAGMSSRFRVAKDASASFRLKMHW